MSLHPSAAYNASRTRNGLVRISADISEAIEPSMSHEDPGRGVVLAFHWENDDMNVVERETDLLEVFREVYNFEVGTLIIPLVDSQKALLSHLTQWFTRNQGDDVVRIVIYSGHAKSVGVVPVRCLLSGEADDCGNPLGPTVDWWSITCYIQGFTGNTCYVFDCCSDVLLCPGDEDRDEMIASCRFNERPSKGYESSFTKVLIDTLRDLNGHPATIAEIYVRLLRLATQRQMASCPVYIPSLRKPSVNIALIGVSPLPQPSLRVDTSDKIYSVLISVKIGDELPPDLAQVQAWIDRNMPPGTLSADVKLEAAFRGSDNVLLMTVPVELWRMMPRDNPAYSFVAHVESHILLPALEPSGLPLPPA